MKTIPLVQIGLGGVGRELARQLVAVRANVARRYNLGLSYLALADSSGVRAASSYLSDEAVLAAVATKAAGNPLVPPTGRSPAMRWTSLAMRDRAIFVDVTASTGHGALLADRASSGNRIVLANKIPLSGDLGHFVALTDGGATRYETTVGAGLPVISTLRGLLDSGDTLIKIEAAMSGTLGFLCAALEAGQPLSVALREAHARGYTEPDPRDDLSGTDVARKALILARTCGYPWSMADIPTEPWFPPELASVSRDEFMARAEELDAPFAERVATAQATGGVLRYVATITPEGATVGLQVVPADHPLASLRGPDNLFSFTTARYAERPLVVRGPGAGQAVTAAGVLADIIATAREMR